MDVDDRPPGRPPDPYVSPQPDPNPPSQDLLLYTPVVTAPLSAFEAMETQVTQQKRKRQANNTDTEVDPESSVTKRDRTVAPSLIARAKYTTTDVAPYIVFVSYAEVDPKAGSTLHPVRFGQLLLKNKIKNITEDGIKKVGRNRVSVEFKAPGDANAFLDCSFLKEKGFSLMIPTFNITRMGVVKGVPADWSDLECSDNLSSPSGFGKILKIRRMNRKITSDGKSEWLPTSTVVLTFDGRALPERVFCCHNSLPVELYHFPTIQCFGCCKFGHTKTQCRSKPRCFRCGEDHFGDGCSSEEPKCLYCDGRHLATSRQCPEYSRQRNIKVYMSEKNVSYSEAARIFPPAVKSFADVVASAPSAPHPLPLSQSARPTNPRQSPSTTSYKRTYFLPPKTHAPLAPGYDQRAHQNLLNSFAFPQPANGCALNINPSSPNENVSAVEQIVMLLTSILSSYPLPDHVANNIINCFRNRKIPSPSMERQECPPEKT